MSIQRKRILFVFLKLISHNQLIRLENLKIVSECLFGAHNEKMYSYSICCVLVIIDSSLFPSEWNLPINALSFTLLNSRCLYIANQWHWSKSITFLSFGDWIAGVRIEGSRFEDATYKNIIFEFLLHNDVTSPQM